MDFKAEATRIERFIYSYVDEANADGVVVGISGGLDSAVVATLAVRALGKDKVHCLFMPTLNTPMEDTEDAGKMMSVLGVDFAVGIIQPIIDSYILPKNVNRAVLGNLVARIRATMLYLQANQNNCLVLGTSDKSELMLGYFTKFGDGAADLLPIAHLYKTEVRQLARFLEIPENIIKKPSSPALIKGQTAEDDLGFTYDEIDRMLKGELPMHSFIEMLISRNEHKKHMPPQLT